MVIFAIKNPRNFFNRTVKLIYALLIMLISSLYQKGIFLPLWTLLANDVTGFLDLVLGLTNGVSFRRPASGVFLR